MANLAERFKDLFEENTVLKGETVHLHCAKLNKGGDKLKNKPHSTQPEVEVEHINIPWQGNAYEIPVGGKKRVPLECAQYYIAQSYSWPSQVVLTMTEKDGTAISRSGLVLTKKVVEAQEAIAQAEIDAKEDLDKEIEDLEERKSATREKMDRMDALQEKKLLEAEKKSSKKEDKKDDKKSDKKEEKKS